MNDFAIEVSGLRKSFHGNAALNGLELRVPAGSIFGFAGRNGAGKTSTIRILMGGVKADAGSVRVLGSPIARTDDSIEQIVRFTRPFFPKWRDDLEKRYMRMFDLPPRKKIPDLSKGMRSKLMLLLAFCRGAELLILDEPTDGLDPVGVEDMLREIVSLSATEGTTVFFSSHQLAEIEQIADHISIIV